MLKVSVHLLFLLIATFGFANISSASSEVMTGPNEHNTCVIPASGPWPACATDGDGAAQNPTGSKHILTGYGDDVVRLERNREFQMLRIVGNDCDRHFSVWALDSSLRRINLLVTTANPYAGAVVIDDAWRVTVQALEVNARCDWSIEFLPVSAAAVLNNPGAYSGFGDNVLAVRSGGILEVTGNETHRYFSIWAYNSDGHRIKQLVATGEPYSGSVLVPSGAQYLTIDAIGAWSLTYP